jgi:hypothetical protein
MDQRSPLSQTSVLSRTLVDALEHFGCQLRFCFEFGVRWEFAFFPSDRVIFREPFLGQIDGYSGEIGHLFRIKSATISERSDAGF